MTTEIATQEFTQPLADDPVFVEPPRRKPWGVAVSINAQFPNMQLFDNEITIGRHQSCGIQLKDVPTVSGKHAKLVYEKADPEPIIWIVDTSTNGTLVNGKKVKKAKMIISNGTEIVVNPATSQRDPIGYLIYVHGKQEEKKEGAGRSIYDTYDVRHKLGNGAFATVNLAINKRTGDKYAVKIIDKKKFALHAQNTSRGNEALKDEARILKKLNHQHIIKVVDMYETDQQLMIILELVTGGDLFDQIVNNNGPYTEERARNLFVQMVHAIEYLHKNGIVHRDLKPENILLRDKKGDFIKVSDFGLSRMIGEGSFMKTLCGTPQYLAPEVLLETKPDKAGYGKAVDIWSLGVILYILLTSIPPFDGDQVLQQVKEARVSYPQDVWCRISASARNLVEQMLKKNVEDRITVEQIKLHPWVQNMPNMPANNKRKAGQDLRATKKIKPNDVRAMSIDNVDATKGKTNGLDSKKSSSIMDIEN